MSLIIISLIVVLLSIVICLSVRTINRQTPFTDDIQGYVKINGTWHAIHKDKSFQEVLERARGSHDA